MSINRQLIERLGRSTGSTAIYTAAEVPVSLCLDDQLSSNHYECTTMRNDGELCQVSDVQS